MSPRLPDASESPGNRRPYGNGSSVVDWQSEPLQKRPSVRRLARTRSRQHSSGGKSTLLGISKRGDTYLRMLLIHGGRSVLLRAGTKDDARSRWMVARATRRGKNIACVAVANKNAWILWAMLTKNESYKTPLHSRL